MTNADETVIGEGVVLDTATANIGTRIVGGLIDVAVTVAVAWGGGVLLDSLVPQGLDFAAIAAISVVFTAFLFVIGPATVETLTRGRSLGKLAMGIRIVRDDGGPISARHAFGRALTAVFETWMVAGMISILVALVSSRGKRVGDMLAGTYAVRVRAARQTRTHMVMPQGLEEWSSTVDIRRLPDGLALTARQFLGRAMTLHPTSRAQIGQRLYEQIKEYVAPLPPHPVHPETFIAAVLVTRRDREYKISLAHQQQDDAQAQTVRRLPFGVAEVLD